MMCMKDVKDTVCDTAESICKPTFKSSFDINMSILKNKNSLKPWKSFSFHHTCNKPVWKIALCVIGIMAVMVIWLEAMFGKKN